MKEMKYDIVWYLSGVWDSDHRRQMIQSFASGKAFKGTILCVNRPMCFTTGLFRKLKEYLRWIRECRKVLHVADNIYVYTPCVLLHMQLAKMIPFIPRINRSILKWQLKWARNKAGFSSQLCLSWMYNPWQWEYHDLVDDSGYIYECYDKYSEFSGPFLKTRELIRRNRELVRDAFIVFNTAEDLYNENIHDNTRCYYIPNGVNVSLFADGVGSNCMAPVELSSLPRPIVGCIGNINSSFIDCELLRRIALDNPSVSFVYIGKLFNLGGVDLLKYPNVVHLGYKRYEELPKYVRMFDLGIIPLKKNKITRALNPLKAYEYMACGIQILSTDVYELRKYSDIISIAKSQNEFRDKLKIMLANNGGNMRARLMSEAKRHDWSRRTTEMQYQIIRNLEMINGH